MRRQDLSVRLVLALAGAQALALAPAVAERLPVRTYTTADGLSHDAVNRVVQDSRGYLWICTDEGLSRFDGYRFTNYGVADGLPGPAVMDLLERRDGSYWVATMSGLARLSTRTPADAAGGQTRALFEAVPIAGAGGVRVLHEDRQGGLWIGSADGLYRVAPGAHPWSSQRVELPAPRVSPVDQQVNAILAEPDGTVWIATRGVGLFRRRPDGTMDRLTTASGLPSDNVRALLIDENGTLWVGTALGLCRLRTSAAGTVVEERFTAREGLPHESVRALLRTRSNVLHVATDVGLATRAAVSEPADAVFRGYTTSLGLPSPFVTSLLEDRDGNVWIGTGEGLVKLVRGGFTTYGPEDGFPHGNGFEAILGDRRGTACVVSKNPAGDRVLQWREGRRFQQVKFRLPVAPGGWGSGQTVLQDSRGDWLVPTGLGIFVFRSEGALSRLAFARPVAHVTERDGLTRDETFRLFEDSRGAVWISPLRRWDRGSGVIEGFPETATYGVSFPSAFAEDRSGNIWIGGYGGDLARYRDGRFDHWTKAQGLPAGTISALYVDRKGRLWIGSDQGGAARVDDPAVDAPQFVHYTIERGLASNEVNCITEDAWGRVYFGTGRGVDRLDPETGRVRRYTSADGLAGSRIRLAFRDREGSLWFGTTNALSRLDPSPEQERPAPDAVISALRIAGAPRAIHPLGQSSLDGLDASAPQSRIEVEFLGISFAPGEVLRFQYRLGRTDDEWSAPTEARSVNYASLAPSRYHFEVRTVTADGALGRPATVDFRVLPPVWRRSWFLTLVLAFVSGALYQLHRYRVTRLLAIERIRTRIATDLHDDIGSSLSRIALLSDVVRQQVEAAHPASGQRLGQIASSARDLVSAMADIVWALDPRHDDLEHVVRRIREFAADVLGGSGVAWSLETPTDAGHLRLDAEPRRHLYLIFKEAITNVARHAGAREVVLRLGVQDGRVQAEIRDDGHGFASHPSAALPRSVGGNGLRNMQARAEECAGKLTVDSAPGRGTRILFELPLDRGSERRRVRNA